MTERLQPLLRLEGLAKSFGPVVAVQPLDLSVSAGDFCAILGPSGCGKSTLLRMIAGLETIDGGEVAALQQRPVEHDQRLEPAGWVERLAARPAVRAGMGMLLG